MRRIGVGAKPLDLANAARSSPRNSPTITSRTDGLSAGSGSGGISRVSSTSMSVSSRSRSVVNASSESTFSKFSFPFTLPPLPWHSTQRDLKIDNTAEPSAACPAKVPSIKHTPNQNRIRFIVSPPRAYFNCFRTKSGTR